MGLAPIYSIGPISAGPIIPGHRAEHILTHPARSESRADALKGHQPTKSPSGKRKRREARPGDCGLCLGASPPRITRRPGRPIVPGAPTERIPSDSTASESRVDGSEGHPGDGTAALPLPLLRARLAVRHPAADLSEVRSGSVSYLAILIPTATETAITMPSKASRKPGG